MESHQEQRETQSLTEVQLFIYSVKIIEGICARKGQFYLFTNELRGKKMNLSLGSTVVCDHYSAKKLLLFFFF